MNNDIIKEILYREKKVIDCLHEWNETEAREHSDENDLLFASNPNFCKSQSMLYIFHLLNRFDVFFNVSEFDECKYVLEQLNKMQLTGSNLIRKLFDSAELEHALANYHVALSLIEEAILLNPTDDEKFKLLMLKGKVEHEINGIPFEVNSFSEALGVAEALDNQDFIAEAYRELYTMFYSRYPGLAVYFARKAEVIYVKQKNVYELITTRLYLSLVLQSIYDRNKIQCFKNEADDIITSIEERNIVLPAGIAFYNRVKGFVLKDEKAIEAALAYYLNSQNESEIIRTLQMMLDVFIYTRNRVKVKKYMPLFRIYFAPILYEELSDIEYRLSRNLPIKPFQEFDNRKPNESTTLFDVLNQIALNEEEMFEKRELQQSFFSDYNNEGKFASVKMPNGKISLIPCGLSINNYYRGEREFHKDCKPSLYRHGMTEAKQFVERVKYAELCLLMEEYPLVKLYRKGISVKYFDGTIKRHEFTIDAMALAQHYGICTELLDFTVDKFVAAFFACTKYNNDGTYSVNDEDGDGCFYYFVDKNMAIESPKNLRSVGLQPFSRPGEQAGYVLSMSENDNLNDCNINAIHFKHNRKVSEFIFNYANRSKKLFPQSILDGKAKTIKESDVFSKKAYEMAKTEFYIDVSDDILMEYLRGEGKQLCEHPIVSFSPHEIDNFYKEWSNGEEQRFYSKILSTRG